MDRQWSVEEIKAVLASGGGAAALKTLEGCVLTEEELDACLNAGPLVDELLAREDSSRALFARNSGRYRSPAVGWELLLRCREAWRNEPTLAARLAELAAAVFESCQVIEDPIYEPLTYSGLAQAWGSLANALRVQGDLPAASKALRTAREFLEQGTGDVEERAWWLRFKASLEADRGDFSQALRSCREARHAFAAAGCSEDAAWMEIKEAVIEGDSGNLERSALLFERFLGSRSEAEVGPEIYSLAQQNLAVTLAQLGRGGEAREVLKGVLLEPQWKSEPLAALRLAWAEGLVLEAEGDFEKAETVLTEVQSGLADKELAYDVALVSLDLVRVLLLQGETTKVCDMSEWVGSIFQSVGVHREATLAGMYLVEAMRRREASLRLVGEILDFLKRARRNPSLKFNPTPS